MVCDLDTICFAETSPLKLAQSAAMPDMRAHFEKVLGDLLAMPAPAAPRPVTRPLAYDMARSASEVMPDLLPR